MLGVTKTGAFSFELLYSTNISILSITQPSGISICALTYLNKSLPYAKA